MALGQTIFRDSRRRRVLQDEARRASNCISAPVTEGARYTDAANVENHPQVTQFIPRRYRSYALGLLAAGVAVVVVQVAHVGSGNVAAAIESGPLAAIDLAAGGGLAAWFGSLVLATLSVVAWMVYNLRKHRVDDYRARYRLWLWVAAAAVVASADTVARLHQAWSSLWVSQTGWAGLGGDAWWIVPTAVFGLWLAIRLVWETAECRGACSLVIASTLAYALAATAAAGLLPTTVDTAELVVISSSLLVGHVLALAAAMLYARYVVLDVQGLIPRKATEAGGSQGGKGKSAPTDGPAGQDASFPATIPINSPAAQEKRKQSRRSSQKAGKQTAWVDGSEPEEDVYDHDQSARPAGKLSKADRKRLRNHRRQCA